MPRIRYKKGYTNIVKVHNNLVEAHYKFSREQQVILLQVAKTLQQLDIFNKYEHTIVKYKTSELLEMLNISDRRTLRGVIRSLQRCIMSFNNIDEHWEMDVNVFISGKYYSEGFVEIEVHKDMLQFFKHLSHELGHYTELNIKEMTQFKSQYTIRLYQLARKLQNIGITKDTKSWKQEKIYTIEEFQKIMGSNYKTWQDLERWVLKPAMEELKDNSFIYVDYEPIKEYKKGQTRGRAGVTKIKIMANRVNHYQGKLY
jgi:plasmid replication initiation protein